MMFGLQRALLVVRSGITNANSSKEWQLHSIICILRMTTHERDLCE